MKWIIYFVIVFFCQRSSDFLFNWNFIFVFFMLDFGCKVIYSVEKIFVVLYCVKLC